MRVKRRLSLSTAWFACCLLIGIVCAHASGQGGAVAQRTFKATDTPRDWTDENADAQAMLDQLKWEPVEFDVDCTSTPGLAYDALVRFESPLPSGRRWVDRVTMSWYAARDDAGNPVEAPAVLLVHSLHPRMLFANQIAREFAGHGLHAFVIQLPGYGQRWSGDRRFPAVTALERGAQAVTDCLRAHDAIRALPNIKPGPVALQGTSLGGFVAATVGGVEPGFGPVILLISGGDCYGTLMDGEHDARRLRIRLANHGHSGEALREMLKPVEPVTVAHRLNPQKTWLITARDDVTIPRASSDALTVAIGLPEDHRYFLGTNHYTTLLMFPAVSRRMAELILGEPVGSEADQVALPVVETPGAPEAKGNGVTEPSTQGLP